MNRSGGDGFWFHQYLSWLDGSPTWRRWISSDWKFAIILIMVVVAWGIHRPAMAAVGLSAERPHGVVADILQYPVGFLFWLLGFYLGFVVSTAPVRAWAARHDSTRKIQHEGQDA